jgi:hypothetical protein
MGTIYGGEDDALQAVTAAIRSTTQHGYQRPRPPYPASPIDDFGQNEYDRYDYGNAKGSGNYSSMQVHWHQLQEPAEAAADSSWGPAGTNTGPVCLAFVS